MSLVLFVMISALASAEYWACFTKGQVIDYCAPINDVTASGNTMRCMDGSPGGSCYLPGNWNVCNTIDGGCTGNSGGNTTIDQQPPNMTILNPSEGAVYTARSVFTNITLNEKGSIYYVDNSNNRGVWTRVCSNCFGYGGKRGYKEGFNNLTFKAIDVVGNEITQIKTFFVDSNDPRISKTLPTKGFSDGTFEVQFQEDNPTAVNLTYGNSATGMHSFGISLASCTSAKGKYACGTSVNLDAYDGQNITYSFSVTDIAGTTVTQKKPLLLSVDTTEPTINNPATLYTISGRYVLFNVSITEQNFDSITYTDFSEATPREKSLCTRLKNGNCEKKQSFKAGNHNVTIQVTDAAGNTVAQGIGFTIA